ncbi:MAG: hypothetical protein D3924_12545 [Candidatus Electrothrix sp. AR4]|nr:hypothetical protein [Candidatus Electrothrix sp. AR4]
MFNDLACGRMKENSEIIRNHFSLTCLVLLVFSLGLYQASLYSYLLFHTLAEFFCIIIACAVFIFAWNTRHLLKNQYILFLGIAYLFIGSMDLVHTLAYKGMNIFEGITDNTSTQIWVAARYMESISILLAFLFHRKKINEYLVIATYFSVTCLFFTVIFLWPIFPDCYLEGGGLTVFKINSEYLICLLLFCSLFLAQKNRSCFDNTVLRFMQTAIIFTIMSELAFTFYSTVYGSFNMTGHFFKIFSFHSIYRAILETGLSKPTNILFRELNTHGTELENKVRERTAALQQSTEHLEKEITERIKAEKELLWELSVNRALAKVSDILISQSFSIKETAELVLSTAKK